MELRVKPITFPEAIEFNFDELKQEITERTSLYTGLVYSEEQIKDAKKDVANLRKFTKALSDERIRIKKQCLQPYEEFEVKIKELSGIVEKAIANIDTQVKGYEEQEKAEKLKKIRELWESVEHPEEMTFEHVFEGKFMNKSCPMSTVEQYMKNAVERFKSDLAALQNLPEFSFEAIEVYKQTLDMHKAISEGKRLADIQKRKGEQEKFEAERKAELERQKAETVQMPECHGEFTDTDKCVENVDCEHGETCKAEAENRTWLGFKAYLTVQDAQQLAAFFNERGIKFERIMV